MKFLESLGFGRSLPVERTVALCPGRFQPFGLHHFDNYRWLRERFDDVVLVTQGRTDPVKNPFDFEEKRRIITGYGIPAGRVIREDRSLVPKAILRQAGFDPRTTAAVVGFGVKDVDLRKHFEKHFTPLEGNEGKLLPCTRRSYLCVIPDTVERAVEGRRPSGTWIRELLGRPDADEETRRRLFREIFGWFDEEIFRMVVSKLQAR